MGFYTVEGEFVAGPATAEGGFSPATYFDAAVSADDGVALFCQGRVGCGRCGDHGFGGEIG